MKTIGTLFAMLVLLGTLAVNAGAVAGEETIYEDGKPADFNPGNDL